MYSPIGKILELLFDINKYIIDKFNNKITERGTNYFQNAFFIDFKQPNPQQQQMNNKIQQNGHKIS